MCVRACARAAAAEHIKTAEAAWRVHRSLNDSFIVDIFHVRRGRGQRSRAVCRVCGGRAHGLPPARVYRDYNGPSYSARSATSSP